MVQQEVLAIFYDMPKRKSISILRCTLGALVGMIATAVNTAATDTVIAGRKCTAFVLSDLPSGKYSPFYENDAKNPAGAAFVKATVK